ncbi:hypothetical protein U6N30_32775 [Blastococcus brunescens]|uniref:Uncharacterized protein n=1 Tax=Blastococcus brunescens TaxID=1564165 RepID=A0ABZ1B4G6_9ACTN|nr:hypothetical protein [Blastococcus sp. BMG 8361]WRL64264.1 hypothetical protein U6N30_32775 [Blastococcus sp. BMG 8361]
MAGPWVDRGPQRWPLCSARTAVMRRSPSCTDSPADSSSTCGKPRPRSQAPAPRGTTIRVRGPTVRREGMCRWSPCRWLMSTTSTPAHVAGSGSGTTRRSRPTVGARRGR